jgi:ATP-dependent Lon protease
MNQKGEVQAIGGVNEKIEGFFDCCKAKGLTGLQGVMIPESNVKDLMLRKDVIEAVKKGKFNIYGVQTIDEGIEILTDKKSGEIKEDGTFPKGTINYLVNERLKALAEGLGKFGKEEENNKEMPSKGKNPGERKK